MDDLFVIAAGGTGAKVAEALIHLCAAGLGPPNVHILLIDFDIQNGNRIRTVETWKAYDRLQRWPWKVRTEQDSMLVTYLFASNVRIYLWAERFDAGNRSELLAQVQDDPELEQALRVLLNESELRSDFSHGFAGRPNVGSIVMEYQLRNHFIRHSETLAFLHELEQSAGREEYPRVTVIGSTFGGTGASLLPVVRRCVHSLFDQPNAQGQMRAHLSKKLRWGKVILLPYFSPVGSDSSFVRPDHHLTDTSSALWYYAEVTKGETLEPTYIVGSEAPHERLVPFELGANQSNPAFYHEIVAALAVLHFHAEPSALKNRPIRHLSAMEAGKRYSLNQLPSPTANRPQLLKKLATLLHLAAFWINWDGEQIVTYRSGLLQFAKSARFTGWNPSVHKRLIDRKEQLTDQHGPGRLALDYFGRSLLWASTSLSAYGASAMEFARLGTAYSSLHNTLCYVTPNELDVAKEDVSIELVEQNDNLVALLCRLALVGLLREDASSNEKHVLRHSYPLDALRLVDDGCIRLCIDRMSIGPSLLSHSLPSDIHWVAAICKQYGLPDQMPDWTPNQLGSEQVRGLKGR